MADITWIDHLSHWKQFLSERLNAAKDQGEREQITRQIRAIIQTELAAVANPSVLTDFIKPKNPAENSDEHNLLPFILDLNDSQKKAVANALSNNELVLIQGPPGTGKTQVIAEICLQLFRKNPGIRIMVCSETHVAVNNLISRIQTIEQGIRIVRIRDKEQDEEIESVTPAAIVTDYLKWLDDNCSDNQVKEILNYQLSNASDKSLEKALALSANIVGLTCSRVGAYSFSHRFEMFDVVIIDEVCKATLPEILLPLSVAKKAILVGDPKQLPPVFCSEDIDLIRSIDRCSLLNHMHIDALFLQAKGVTVLDTQYRMNNQIGNLISNLFYDGLLKNGRQTDCNNALIWVDYLPSQEWPVKTDEQSDMVIYNKDECNLVAKVLDRIDETCQKTMTVGIIAPYRKQVAIIRQNLPPYSHLRVEVNTVDGFQGKECDVVVFSLTRTTGSYRFLADSRRLNVALSRARNNIIIVGYAVYAIKHKLFKAIFDQSVKWNEKTALGEW